MPQHGQHCCIKKTVLPISRACPHPFSLSRSSSRCPLRHHSTCILHQQCIAFMSSSRALHATCSSGLYRVRDWSLLIPSAELACALQGSSLHTALVYPNMAGTEIRARHVLRSTTPGAARPHAVRAGGYISIRAHLKAWPSASMYGPGSWLLKAASMIRQSQAYVHCALAGANNRLDVRDIVSFDRGSQTSVPMTLGEWQCCVQSSPASLLVCAIQGKPLFSVTSSACLFLHGSLSAASHRAAAVQILTQRIWTAAALTRAARLHTSLYHGSMWQTRL